ncbi:MAG: cell division protein ZapA [Clostridia bacterium]|nr:cell division protein ZapA [Clostridia bacterium]
MAKTRIIVRIAGREYPITSSDSEEYVRRVARYVDRKISDLSLATRLPAPECATLAAVTIADELAKMQEELNRVRAQMESERDELQKLRAEKEGKA